MKHTATLNTNRLNPSATKATGVELFSKPVSEILPADPDGYTGTAIFGKILGAAIVQLKVVFDQATAWVKVFASPSSVYADPVTEFMADSGNGEDSDNAYLFGYFCAGILEADASGFAGNFRFSQQGAHGAVTSEMLTALKLNEPSTIGAFLNRATRVLPWNVVVTSDENARTVVFTAAGDYGAVGIVTGDLILSAAATWVQPPLGTVFE